MADLKLVKSERLDREGVYSEIRNGNCVVANLTSRSGLTRGVVRGMIREVWKGNPPKIKHPRGPAPKGSYKPEKRVPPMRPSRLYAGAIAFALTAVAAALAITGIAWSYQYFSSFGGSSVMGILGAAFDCLAVLIPMVAAVLWDQRRFGLFVMAGSVWVMCSAFSIVSAMSFAAVNVGDRLQMRDSVALHRQALNNEVTGVQAEMGRIGNVEDPRVIEENIQIARGRIPVKNLVSSRDCTDVTASGPFCAELNQLRGAKRASERRIELDARLSRLNEEIAGLPAVSERNPVAAVISRLSWGLVGSDQIEIFWIVGLGCISSLAGMILMFAGKIAR